mmetsp:Transcript_18266/g.38151  ORF Transcript_18266/g.38151 Transcript_18266/m.38151 type:complete len:95 (-) Transcript_18266:406-690(-)
MGYIETWDEFAAQAHELFLRAPLKTRYSFKYRAKDGQLVLKVTDDRTCLKFKTDQRSDLRRIEILTDWMMTGMSLPVENDNDLESRLAAEGFSR